MPWIYPGGRAVWVEPGAVANTNIRVLNNASGSSPAAVAAMVQNTPAPRPAQPEVQVQKLNPAPVAPAPTPTPDPQKAYYDWLKQQEQQRKTDAQNAYLSTLRGFFDQNGMGKLFAAAEKYVRAGYTDDSIYFMIQNDPDYKQAYNERFSANALRRQNKLPELLPGTYVAMEAAYRQAMLNRGIPAGLFDQSSDFDQLIGNDVSAQEVASRLDKALDYVNYNGNENVRTQLRDIYGLTDGEMAAYVLDPKKTLDYLQKEYSSNMRRATVGGAAQTVGVDLSKQLRDEIAGVYDQTVATAYDQSMARFGNVAEQAPTYMKLAGMSGESANTDELVRQEFNLTGSTDITGKKKRLASQERARFSGASGVGKTSLSATRMGETF